MSSLSARLACAGAAAALVAVLTSVSPAAADPPGGNGTIKVDGLEFDGHPNNEPHVGCTFEVDFYGFDAGVVYADVTFEAQAPTVRTGDTQVLLTDRVFVGEDDSSGGGSEAGLDASATYELDFTDMTPHPIQGYHVELTTSTPGKKGAATKHKVLWDTDCGPPIDQPPDIPF